MKSQLERSINNPVTQLKEPQLGIGGSHPRSFDEYVGQAAAKRKAVTAAQSAKIRGVPMKHMLIAAGQPGIGKTTLALLIADFLGVGMRFASGKIKYGQARMLLANMSDRDVLIIDEFHQMVTGAGKREGEWLLHYLENGCLAGPMGVEEQPQVTVIACTTEAGLVPDAIADRFVQVELKTYTEAEATQICTLMAQRIFDLPLTPPPTKDNCAAIARAASNNPRTMRALLETTRDWALVSNQANWTSKRAGYDLAETLSQHGLTSDGLTPLAQKYLVALAEFGGEPAGESKMKDRLQEPGGLRAVERTLMAKGYITKTGRGRVLTQTGIRRLRSLDEMAA